MLNNQLSAMIEWRETGESATGRANFHRGPPDLGEEYDYDLFDLTPYLFYH
jgi:hypothetical protein